MIYTRIFLYSIAIINMSLIAGAITIHNHTEYPVYAGVYYVRTNLLDQSQGPALLQSPAVAIQPKKSVMMTRPRIKIMYNREIIVSTKQTDIAPHLPTNLYTRSALHRVGWHNGTVYHVAERAGKLVCYDDTRWPNIKPLVEKAAEATDVMLQEIRDIVADHPYRNTHAAVRPGSTLSSDEALAVATRADRAQKALARIYGAPLKQAPRIALCLSGGGMRAAISTTGLLSVLADIGVLDAVTYIAALSGSTWATTSWMVFGQTLSEYSNYLSNVLASLHAPSPDAIAGSLWPKYLYNQPMSIVDLYGAYLATTFFAHLPRQTDRTNVKFSSIQRCTQTGAYPFPLCTALEASIDNNWVTFTPFDVMSETLNFSIPVWAFGRPFVGGNSTNFAPELSLGFMMGLWGSALSGTIEEMLMLSAENIPPLLLSKLQEFVQATDTENVRLAPVKIQNPLYGIPESSHRARSIKDFVFMDAGYAYNLPLPPLMRPDRAVDIILILDVSEDVYEGFAEFKKAEAHIRTEGWPFPPIDYTKLGKQPVTVFQDTSNPTVPTVIYYVPMRDSTAPTALDPAKEFLTTYKTSNFSYTRRDIDRLMGLIRTNIISSKEQLYAAINERVQSNMATA